MARTYLVNGSSDLKGQGHDVVQLKEIPNSTSDDNHASSLLPSLNKVI